MVLDEKRRATLLQRITEEGGFAYVSSAEKAAAGDLRAAEAAREMAWEQLHSGPWNQVVPSWRDAYAMACLYVAELRAGVGDRREALRALDMGLIMGGALLRPDLDDAVDRIVSMKGAEDEIVAGVCNDKWREAISANRDLAEALGILPNKSLSSKKVEKQSSLSLETFLCNYFSCDSPVIISGCIDHWPARTKWKDIEYLKRVAGDRTVPVEVGKDNLSSEWKRELITFSEFLERIQSTNISSNMTHLTQHPLLDQIRELRDDIMIPDYCSAGGGELRSLNAWFGSLGSVTPLHHDSHHNIFAQNDNPADPTIDTELFGLIWIIGLDDPRPPNMFPIRLLGMVIKKEKVVGRKYIRLYPAAASESMYPREEPMLSHCSQVDLDNIDLYKFPKVEDLGFVDCVLEEGELLYIPPKWWYYVRSLSASLSVSFGWRSTAAPSEATTY